MRTLSQAVYLDSEFGVVQDLPRAGSTLEHPLVFDSVARDLKRMAGQGLLEIVREHRSASAGEELIDRLQFKRLR
ncbi:hypothetical protein [Piscinibacter sp. XHJ-5]|uniref:hypothetical protein n=1 Tax=Piscinibacter sp. XHJ-5 TaxID=3037797 RepID=UPI0024532D7C|nr:hypothetical protein [Piscinibacter sp. XHJ-5]